MHSSTKNVQSTVICIAALTSKCSPRAPSIYIASISPSRQTIVDTTSGKTVATRPEHDVQLVLGYSSVQN